MGRRLYPGNLFNDDGEARFFIEKGIGELKTCPENERRWFIEFVCNDMPRGKKNKSEYLRSLELFGQPTTSNLQEAFFVHHYMYCVNLPGKSLKAEAFREINQPQPRKYPTLTEDALRLKQKSPDYVINLSKNPKRGCLHANGRPQPSHLWYRCASKILLERSS
jgi:hypothetical protein